MCCQLSYQQIFGAWVQAKGQNKCSHVFDFIAGNISTGSSKTFDDSLLQNFVRRICNEFNDRWKKSYRTNRVFLKNNAAWLTKNIDLTTFVCQRNKSMPVKTGGRPEKDFKDCSDRTKEKKAKELLTATDENMLFKAAEMKLRSHGKRVSATIVKELFVSSPERGSQIKRRRKSAEQSLSLSPEQSLAMIVDLGLSTHQYKLLRQYAMSINSKIFPSYDPVRISKCACYPDAIIVTESYAEVRLQSLIDHTISRLCMTLEEVFERIPEYLYDVQIIIKWGCDGAQHNKYKQKFKEETASDGNLFSISMVPIEIIAFKRYSKQKVIIWKNTAPSSTRYCRPIKFVFAKETREFIRDEVSKIELQISAIIPTTVAIGEKDFNVKPTLVLCMIDGKVCSALSEYSSSQVCYICGAKPSSMNDPIAITNKPIDEKMLSLGISPLHARIRSMECLLHIAYKINIKQWQAKGDKNKEEVLNRKTEIQQKFKNEMGLLVDMPNQTSGNTNDGNTARRFFRNAEKSAEITGIDKDLIHRFQVILECLASGYEINSTEFDKFAIQTRNLYLEKYHWYYMPVTVHKILFHGKDIIENCILPIGQLSEEAQEARNKDTRNYRQRFTRKTSRVDSNADLLHRLLISSDPLMCSLRMPPKTKRGDILPEVLTLLQNPDIIIEDPEL